MAHHTNNLPLKRERDREKEKREKKIIQAKQNIEYSANTGSKLTLKTTSAAITAIVIFFF